LLLLKEIMRRERNPDRSRCIGAFGVRSPRHTLAFHTAALDAEIQAQLDARKEEK
jgi:hypothetical protein